MFEVKFLVVDRKLADALLALDGIPAQPPVVDPVRVPLLEGPKVTKSTTNGHSTKVEGSGADMVLKYIRDHKLDVVDTKQVREVLPNYTSSGRTFALRRLMERGHLKKSKKFGHYVVVKK